MCKRSWIWVVARSPRSLRASIRLDHPRSVPYFPLPFEMKVGSVSVDLFVRGLEYPALDYSTYFYGGPMTEQIAQVG